MRKNPAQFLVRFVLIIIISAGPILATAQSVGISTDGSLPDASAILDVKSTNKGVLVPRMTTTERTAISSPAAGLLVFDTDTGSFWFYTGSVWSNMASALSGWALTGNSGTNGATHFIGTIDNQSLNVRVNNLSSGLIDHINSNTGWGYLALLNNTTGESNTAVGREALADNTTAGFNTAVGVETLRNNTTGEVNTAIGIAALYSNQTGNSNTAIGGAALYGNTTGESNTAVGREALADNTTGGFNTAIGRAALRFNITGESNTAVGSLALFDNTTGQLNTALGREALRSNTTGLYNTATGSQSLILNSSGIQNTANGFNSLVNNITGGNNTAHGFEALSGNSSGNNNTAVGFQAMTLNNTGNGNTAIGANASVAGANFTNATAIGAGATVNASNKVRIGNGAVTVIEGQVPFTSPSDGRFKYNVQEDVKGLDFIMRLRPVTYNFDVRKLDEQFKQASGKSTTSDFMQASYIKASAIRRTGFIAQEVEQAANQSGYNFSGIIKPETEKDHYSLSYESFVVPMVKAIQEQENEIAKLKVKAKTQESEIAELKAMILELKREMKKSK